MSSNDAMSKRSARRALEAVIQAIRIFWPIIFLIPLGFWAGRYCAFAITDPAYHALLWAHERIWLIWAALAVLSVGSVAVRVVRAERQVEALIAFKSEPDPRVQSIFAELRDLLDLSAGLIVLKLPARVAFPHWRTNAVVISTGMLQGLSPTEVRLLMLHELEHLRRLDQWRALAWRAFFALLILPGFDALEQLLNRRRERTVDEICVPINPAAYETLLQRNSLRRDKLFSSICSSNVGAPGLAGLNAAPQYVADRSLAAALSALVLGLVLLGHMLFVSALPYLVLNHC